MDIHKNARLTLRSREALVENVIHGFRFSRAAASFRVTPKTAAKWVRRYQSEGVAGLRDRDGPGLCGAGSLTRPGRAKLGKLVLGTHTREFGTGL